MKDPPTWFYSAFTELSQQAIAEFKKKDPEYGSAWFDLDIEDLKRIVKGESVKLASTIDETQLKHRIIDLINYTIFLYVQIQRREEKEEK